MLCKYFDNIFILLSSGSSLFVIGNQKNMNKKRLRTCGVIRFFCLFDLILYVPVNNLSVMSGRVFLG